MKAVVVRLVVVLALLAWPCAAQDHYCSAADTVVSAGEQKTVAYFWRGYGPLMGQLVYLHPESAFEGVLVNITTSNGTNMLWFPAHTHCFTHNRGWWRVWVSCFYTDTYQECGMKAGVCGWYCRDPQLPGQPQIAEVVAVGASRWRAAEPPDNCTVIYLELPPSNKHDSCSPQSKHSTTDSPSTTTTTIDSPSTTTTTTTTDSPSTTTTRTTTTDSLYTATTTTPTTTTTDSPSTTTTTDCPTTTTTTNLLPMLLVVVVVVVAVVVVMVAMVMMVMKIRHNSPRAPGLSSSSSSSPGFLYKQKFDNVAEYC